MFALVSKQYLLQNELTMRTDNNTTIFDIALKLYLLFFLVSNLPKKICIFVFVNDML